MVARDIAFVSTDVDGKHDSYAVVINISLHNINSVSGVSI
jgi:hypothetical protein